MTLIDKNGMTVKEVADFLGVSRYVIYRLLKNGKLPGLPIFLMGRGISSNKLEKNEMTVREVAYFLDVSQTAVYQFLKRGVLRGEKKSGAWRIVTKDVVKWVKEKSRIRA